jgi:hypothetical protein
VASCLPRPSVVRLRAQVSSNVRPHNLPQARLLALLSIQYSVPALVYFGIALVRRQTIWMEDGRWVVQNYICMVAPHVLLGVAAGAFTRSRKHLVANLFVAWTRLDPAPALGMLDSCARIDPQNLLRPNMNALT